jgi:hypothetical protein
MTFTRDDLHAGPPAPFGRRMEFGRGMERFSVACRLRSAVIGAIPLHPATPAPCNVGYLQNEKQVRALLMASGSDDICLMAQALRLLVCLLMCPVLAHPVFARPVFACPLLACLESLRGAADPKRAPGFPKTKSPKTGSPGIWHLPGSGISC